jgi:hypothetical protein
MSKRDEAKFKLQHNFAKGKKKETTYDTKTRGHRILASMISSTLIVSL